MTDDQTKCGRPAEYTAEIGRAIWARLVDGESLRAICADAGMPDKATVLGWLTCHKEFRHWYAVALEAQVDDLFDQTFEIADDRSGDWVEKVRADGRVVTVPDRDNLARSRLRCDVRTWVADRLAPNSVVNSVESKRSNPNVRRT